MENFSLSYREVIPDLSSQEEWVEIVANTGGTQSTLQDIKVAEKAGGYCYQNVELNHNRNRFIYWRTYQDVLELSEISLDFNLYQNNIRLKFPDSPVISVSITEQERFVTLLVITVSSLHRINFPHPDVLADGSGASSSGGSSSGSGGSFSGASSSVGISVDFNETQSYSIFREVHADAIRDPRTFCVIDMQNGLPSNPVPHAAVSYLAQDGSEAHFALACQSVLMLYIMNCFTGQTTAQQLKENNLMPRLLSNLKGALTGRSDSSDADHATALVFNHIDDQVFLLALYRNDQLRMWSTQNFQNVANLNCVRDGNERRMQGPQSNALRKISEESICAFISHATGAEFVCIDIGMAEPSAGSGANGPCLMRRKVIAAPQLDLADFDVSAQRIWALWSNAEGEFSISNYPLVRGMGMTWLSAAMEPPPDRYCVGVEQGMDPREAYCKYIFHPGKFERAVIAKALFMFRRSNVRYDSKHCSPMSLLRDQVCQTVEEEIQNELKDFDTTDDDYLEVATRLWERFYTCCEQYHMKSSQPTGLLILEPIDGVCVVKKSSFSLLRPCEALEHLMLSGEDVDVNVVVPSFFPDERRAGEDLVTLMSLMAQLEKWLPEDIKIEFDHKLYQLEMPGVLIANLVGDILAGDPDKELFPRNFLVSIRQKLQTISDVRVPMELLLKVLRMDNGDPAAMQQSHLNVAHSTRFLMSIGALFGSQVGLSLLSETVRQTALIRFAICRNLLILQQILINTYSLSVEILEELRSQFMPETVTFLQAYYVMVWISETPVNMSHALALETSITRLNLLQLTSGAGRIYSNAFGKCHAAPLLRIFLHSKGLYHALALYAVNCNKTLDSPKWQNTLIPLQTIVSQLIWAVSYNFIFGEWLFGTCLHIVIQEYVRLLNNWCEWNISSRQFILAASLLDCSETYKSYDLFLQAGKGVLKEQFLREKILGGNTTAPDEDMEDEGRSSEAYKNQVTAQYYLKVIQLFEQHNAMDYIISMAQVAIGLLLDSNDPLLPMFQSIVFNNHLKLEHYEEAYHSLIYNAEMPRRKDCLRQLVVTLFSTRRLDLLMHFPYVGLHEEFENIVESRARSLVIDKNEIYNFLYAFHVNNGNMRKASAAMYEQAMRLKMESDSIEAMQKRCASLLVCINALHLIDPRYRWIAKPVLGEDLEHKKAQRRETLAANSSSDSSLVTVVSRQQQQKQQPLTEKAPQVVVLEIVDIRRELLQTEALVSLWEQRADAHAFLHAGPQELSFMLASCGLFTCALKLANGFKFTLLPIFDSLTTACVRTAEENPHEAWSWLQENNLAGLPHRNSAADMAWSLLQKLIEEHEAEATTLIRKTVVNKILSLNAFVPQWLYNDYKASNCSELLRLYVKHNRLLEAADLAEEMLNAMLGAGCEYFSFKHTIAVTNPEMCLPLNTLDVLLHGLKLNSEQDEEYKQAVESLEEVIAKYVETALRTADDKIAMTSQGLVERDDDDDVYIQ